jgi:glucose-1-phosphate adenylyltransferase
MERGVLGVIVTGGGGAPFDALGVGGDAALTPFGGKYRFIDFALAALGNAGLTRACVVAPGPAPALRAHLEGAERPIRPEVRELPRAAKAAGRATRIALALAQCGDLVGSEASKVVIVLVADHILRLDPWPLA